MSLDTSLFQISSNEDSLTFPIAVPCIDIQQGYTLPSGIIATDTHGNMQILFLVIILI